MNDSEISYWKWLFFGINGKKSGIKSYCNLWIFLHLFISTILTINITIKQSDAISIAIPFIGILIALTVSWCGNVTSLLNTKEITLLSTRYTGGIEGYAYFIQSAILVLFITVLLWTIYGLNILSCKIFLFIIIFMSSIAIRDCWNVILLGQMLTIARARIIINKKND